ncbi:MAG: hypothetical protein GF393_11400 [Armatimonadia bacterium]|nr:hypothetical protein [Armatimonadia bacterium]
MDLSHTLAVTATLALLHMAACAAPLSWDGVEVRATDDNGTATGDPRMAIDGDEETVWSGDGHDLTARPTSYLILFESPTAVGSLEMLTDDLKGRVRLTALEVYAAVDGGWAQIGSVEGNEALRFTIDLTPIRTDVLRLRIMDTARPDHAWPRIHEMWLHAPDDGAELRSLEAAEVPGEGRVERLFLDRTLGCVETIPEAMFDSSIGYLGYVRRFIDTLIEHGTDRYGEVHSPMWVSVLSCRDLSHPGCELPAIEGQRQHDRAVMGGNLQHDLMLLLAARETTELTGDARYEEAAEDYLRFFLTNCTHTPTGLWPWGEHAHWDFHDECVGHYIHEHLGAAPLRFWEWAWDLSPEAVLREADGLMNHVVDVDTFDYNRHADVNEVLPEGRTDCDWTFLDFPRHGGFYLQVWAFAWSRTGDQKYLDRIEKMMDHHERAMHPDSGLLPATTTNSATRATPSSQLSLAITMLESVPLLGETETGERCEQLAHRHLEALAALPHEPAEGRYIGSCPIAGTDAEGKIGWIPTFSANYGQGFACAQALLWTAAHRLTGEHRYLDLAREMAEWYARVEELPKAEHIRAQVFAGIINLMMDMHELDGGDQWLPAAERFARMAVEGLYCEVGEDGIFRGATNLWYYESELWVSNLAYALVRLHTLTEDTDATVPANYFMR